MKLSPFIRWRFITRRRVKRTGLVICILLLGSSIASFGWVANWVVRKPDRCIGVHLWNGCVWYSSAEIGAPLSDYPSGFHVYANEERSIVVLPEWPTPHTYGGMGEVASGRLPLWMPLLLLAIPTAWLWRSDRRSQPWQCRGCRYDLRGLEGGGQEGVCPECGLAKGEG